MNSYLLKSFEYATLLAWPIQNIEFSHQELLEFQLQRNSYDTCVKIGNKLPKGNYVFFFYSEHNQNFINLYFISKNIFKWKKKYPSN